MKVQATTDGWCASVRAVVELEFEGVSHEMQSSDEQQSDSDDDAVASRLVPSEEHVRTAMLAMAEKYIAHECDAEVVAKWTGYKLALNGPDPASVSVAIATDEGALIRHQLYKRGLPFDIPLEPLLCTPGHTPPESPRPACDAGPVDERRKKKMRLYMSLNRADLQTKCGNLELGRRGSKKKLATRLVRSEYGDEYIPSPADQIGEEGNREEGGEAGGAEGAGGEEGAGAGRSSGVEEGGGAGGVGGEEGVGAGGADVLHPLFAVFYPELVLPSGGGA